MGKLIFLFAVFFLLVPGVVSVSTDLRTSYAPKETMIGEISGGILAPIQKEKVRVVKDGHLDVGVQFDVARIGGKQFVWIMAPANSGEYTLIVKDVVAFVDGAPEVIDFTHDFSVQGGLVSYSVSPGFISTSKDFKVAVTSYVGQQTVSADFPEQREITLYPGTNYIDFSISRVLGVQQIMVNLGIYQIPVRILGASYICGDGGIDDVEVCDGENLNGKECVTIPGDFVDGVLRCSSGCLAFDTSLCELSGDEEPECDSENLDLCLNSTDCVSAEGYWYDEICNQYEQGAKCDSEHVGLCVTHGTCIDAGGYWYDSVCNENEEVPEVLCGDELVGAGEECDGENLSESNCSGIGFDGGDLTCNAVGSEKECKFNVSECYLLPPPAPTSFVIDPAVIKSTIFTERDLPVYHFIITNEGGSEITGMVLDFNPVKFSVEPNRNISIGINESLEFNLTLKEVWRGRPFKGVVIANYEEIFEYMLVDINFTLEEAEAITAYSRNSTTSGPSYYCSELSGYSCASDETCDEEVVSTIDFSECCVGNCSDSGGSGGNSWIGWLIAGIVVVVCAIIFLKYRKSGKSSSKSPLHARLSNQKGLP